jgi:hypothetical protein
MELTGCGALEAGKALAEHKEVWLAVDALLTKPVVSGEKYIPKKPEVDTGLTEEQKERCGKGRWLQDQVNAVFSVAHSQTRSLPVQVAPLALQASHPDAGSPALPTAPPGSPQDGLERMTLPTLQSETLQ